MKAITILGLHLGFGGVEQSIITQANALSKNYKVELVVNYKLMEHPAFYVDPKIKIKYLMSELPNREEFKESLRKKKLFSAFKEGLKSIKILYKKKKTMKEYIKNCTSEIIISSRIEIAELLGKNKPENTITITEEHCHHNQNKKYINRVKKACKNIDYLVLVSKELKRDYERIITGAKCIYLPNGLDEWPDEIAKLDSKNLVSVGRLSKEKGYLDLIEVMSLIKKEDPSIHLDIIGDGQEYKEIEAKIKEYQLEKQVTLHGYQKKEYIKKIELTSSLYMMCSFEESFGIVLIEAGALGVPAIAFNSAQGANEIIKNEKSGIIIANRDKEKMAKKTIELLKNRKELKKMGEEARIVAKEFSFDSIQKKWLEFIKDVEKND